MPAVFYVLTHFFRSSCHSFGMFGLLSVIVGVLKEDVTTQHLGIYFLCFSAMSYVLSKVFSRQWRAFQPKDDLDLLADNDTEHSSSE